MGKINIEDIKSKATTILRDNGVTKAAVFGSVARGEANDDSDIDFLVELPREQSLLDIIHLKHELEDALEMPVDLVEYGAIKPLLETQIMREQISIL